MAWIKELLSEKGCISTMRLMSLMCCFNAIAISWIGISKPTIDYSGLSLLVSAFLTAAMGGKIMQKRVEVSGATADVGIEK